MLDLNAAQTGCLEQQQAPGGILVQLSKSSRAKQEPDGWHNLHIMTRKAREAPALVTLQLNHWLVSKARCQLGFLLQS